MIDLATSEDIKQVIDDLSPYYFKEWSEIHWRGDKETFLDDLEMDLRSNYTAPKYAVRADGEAVCVGGWEPFAPGVMQAYLLGSRKLKNNIKEYIRFAKNMNEALIKEDSIHRIQVLSLDDNPRFFKFLGFKDQQVLNGYGRDGLTYQLYSTWDQQYRG